MVFNAEKFLNSTVQGASSTVVLVCPEGEYKAFTDDGDKAITFRDGDAARNLSPQCIVLFAITGDQEPNKFLKREKVLVPMTCWLDLTEDGEGLDMAEGKNVNLGRLRKAIGQNDPSAPWNPMMMKGKGPVMIKVGQRSDDKDPSIKYAEVRRVAAITS